MKLGRLYTIRGKKNAEVKELVCGDIGAIAKMDIRTGDTLCDERKVVSLKKVHDVVHQHQGAQAVDGGAAEDGEEAQLPDALAQALDHLGV